MRTILIVVFCFGDFHFIPRIHHAAFFLQIIIPWFPTFFNRISAGRMGILLYIILAILFADYIYSQYPKGLQIVIKTLTVSGQSVFLQIPLGSGMVSICSLIIHFLHHSTSQIIQIQFLVLSFRHSTSYVTIG